VVAARPPRDAADVLIRSQDHYRRSVLHAAAIGIKTAAPQDPAHRRLIQMRDFYRFMLREIPTLPHRRQRQQLG